MRRPSSNQQSSDPRKHRPSQAGSSSRSFTTDEIERDQDILNSNTPIRSSDSQPPLTPPPPRSQSTHNLSESSTEGRRDSTSSTYNPVARFLNTREDPWTPFTSTVDRQTSSHASTVVGYSSYAISPYPTHLNTSLPTPPQSQRSANTLFGAGDQFPLPAPSSSSRSAVSGGSNLGSYGPTQRYYVPTQQTYTIVPDVQAPRPTPPPPRREQQASLDFEDEYYGERDSRRPQRDRRDDRYRRQ